MANIFYEEDEEEENKTDQSYNDIIYNMIDDLDKLNPKFRLLTDLLFFSEKNDVDLSEYKTLYKENYKLNYNYFQNRFEKTSEIFWDNIFWSNKFKFILLLNDKKLLDYLESFLEKRMTTLLKTKSSPNIKYDIPYLQYLEYAKAKKEKNISTGTIKLFLTEIVSFVSYKNIISIIDPFIPDIFTSIDEYTRSLSKKIIHYPNNFSFLLKLREQGINFDKKPIVDLAKSILLKNVFLEKHRTIFLTMILDLDVLQEIKKEYSDEYRNGLLSLLEESAYYELDQYNWNICKNLIKLDPEIADQFAIIYAKSLYQNYGTAKYNTNKLVKLIKNVPQISPKKILVWQSSNNKMEDIKFMIKAFPELKNLSAFI